MRKTVIGDGREGYGRKRVDGLVLALSVGLGCVFADLSASGLDSGPAAAIEAALAEADRAWSSRADELEGRLALPDKTEQALEGYREAIEMQRAADGNGNGASARETQALQLEARWKALQAAHYLSDFTTASESREARAIEEATSLAEDSLAWLERIVGTDLEELDSAQRETRIREAELSMCDVALLRFWSAIVWGARGQRVGLVMIVMEGIARRMVEGARLAVDLDPTIERGGAYRLLSRLHADLPRVPFVTGFVDRDKALPMAERAIDVAPEDPGNQLILALALLDFAPDRRAEAEERLATVAELEPRPELRAEDLATRHRARQELAELRSNEE